MLKKGLFTTLGLSIVGGIILLYLWPRPQYVDAGETLHAGYLLLCQLKQSYQNLPAQTFFVLETDPIEAFNQRAGTGNIVLIKRSETVSFEAVRLPIAHNLCQLLTPKAIKTHLQGQGYQQQSGILPARQAPLITEYAQIEQHSVRLEGTPFKGFAYEVKLGGPNELIGLGHVHLRYNDISIQLFAYDYGSHGGADNDLTYTVVEDRVQVQRFTFRPVILP